MTDGRSGRGLRVLSLNYEYPPVGGGGGNAHRHILQEFAKFPDITLDLVTVTPEAEPRIESPGGGVTIHFLPIRKKSLHYWRRSEVIAYLASHARFLNRHLKTREYDLCHVFFGFPSGALAYFHRRRFPYIVSVRGSDVPGYNARFLLDYIILRPLLNRVYRGASAVVANSRRFGDLFDSQFPGLRADVIPNGVDTDWFRPADKPPGGDTVEIVSVARLIPRKGLDTLIRACKRLADNEVQFVCHIAGEGPEEGNLRALAAELGLGEAVRFHGRLERDEIRDLLPRCGIFALPSHAEGMPNAALEAMACGLPLVLTDTGGSDELVGDNGYVVPRGDAEALAEPLLRLCRNAELRGAMARRSRERAGGFAWRRVAERYLEVYRKAAGDAAP